MKKNAKANERLRDLAALRQDKVKVEQDLADLRKKFTEQERVLKLRQKDQMDKQRRNSASALSTGK